VPHQRSEDGWIRVIDGEVRGSFYKPTNDNAHESIGGIKQTVSESAIANTQLSGVMSAGESRLLLAGGAMKGFLVKKLAAKQRTILTQLGEALRGADAAGCGLAEFGELRSLGAGRVSQDKRDEYPPSKVSDMLKRCETALLAVGEVGTTTEENDGAPQAEAAAAAGGEDKAGDTAAAQKVLANAMKSCEIDCEGLAWVVLRDLGSVVASYGQLSTSQKEAIHSYLKTEMDDDKAGGANDDNKQEDEMDKFVQFCRDHPGSMYKDDPVMHKQMMLSVTLSKK